MPYRILVVEDTEATRYLQATWLRRAGFEVIEAMTGSEALKRVDAETDVVVLDVHLPDMSGFDVCTAIKSDPATSAVPVMHVSATAVDVRSRSEGLDRGADAYLVEPVEREEFLATVRSLARVHTARRSAARLSQRLSRLASATLPVNAADSVARLLEAAAKGAADVFNSPALAVAETEAGLAVRALCAGEGHDPVSQTFGAPLSQEWSGGRLYVDASDLPAPWPAMLERAGVPNARWFMWPVRRGDDAVFVGLAVSLPEAMTVLPPEEEQILGRLVDSVAVALQNLRAFSQEHRTALTLQSALLPEHLPEVPGLAFAARYNASSDFVTVGGDFYDVFVLPEGHVAVVIGDVQGHSLQAAILMAQLRFALRAFMVEHRRPAPVVELLNALLLTYHPDVTATLVLLLIDPDLASMEIVNAGHLPPLLLDAGSVRYLEGDNPLLGLPSSTPTSEIVPLHPGTDLILVTDGLIERRGQSLTDGLAALQSVAGTPAGSAAELADLLVDRFDVGSAEDDVAVVVLRRG